MSELTIDTSDIAAAIRKNLADFEPSLEQTQVGRVLDRKSTRLNSSHALISYAVFCLKKKKKNKKIKKKKKNKRKQQKKNKKN